MTKSRVTVDIPKDKRTMFKEIYRLFFPVICGSLYTKVNDRDLAADLAQDVFVDCLLNLDKIENIRAWLFRAVRNRLIDYYRKKKNMTQDVADLEASGDIALTYINGFKDTRIIIQEAVDTISNDSERNIFELVAVQNYSYSEAGKALGLTKRQIFYRYTKIVENILDFLKNKKGINSIEELL
ncbi:MAG: sigma-70 family RNA polymerase sigma factor [bacterium]|nr:sigma-70 family RNA polymerase sigma factor [bacterium]